MHKVNWCCVSGRELDTMFRNVDLPQIYISHEPEACWACLIIVFGISYTRPIIGSYLFSHAWAFRRRIALLPHGTIYDCICWLTICNATRLPCSCRNLRRWRRLGQQTVFWLPCVLWLCILEQRPILETSSSEYIEWLAGSYLEVFSSYLQASTVCAKAFGTKFRPPKQALITVTGMCEDKVDVTGLTTNRFLRVSTAGAVAYL